MYRDHCTNLVFSSVLLIFLLSMLTLALNTSALSQYYKKILPDDNKEFEIARFHKIKTLDEFSCLLECNRNVKCNGVLFEVNKSNCFIIVILRQTQTQTTTETTPAQSQSTDVRDGTDTSNTTTAAMAETTTSAVKEKKMKTTTTIPSMTFAFRRKRKRLVSVHIKVSREIVGSE